MAAIVATVLKSQLDRIATGRQAMRAAFATGFDFWAKADGASDEAYENRVKGTALTAMDAALEAAAVFSTPALQQWFVLHNAYFNIDLGLEAPYFQSYLETKGWRVPYEAAESLYEALSRRLPFQRVFPKGTRPGIHPGYSYFDTGNPSEAGMHLFGSWTGTATYESVDGALPVTVKAAPVAIVSRESSPGGTSPVLTATLQDGTTKDIGFTPHTGEYGIVYLGAGAIGIGGASNEDDNKDVLIKTAVTQFKVGEWVLLAKVDLTVVEVAQIAVIGTPALTLSMESNLINAWLEDDIVVPMFSNVAYKSGSITTGEHHLDIYAMPDRRIIL